MERHFERGEAIRYRQVRGGRVMLAAPLRVVEDTPERVVLYQAPDTAFKSARTAGGKDARHRVIERVRRWDRPFSEDRWPAWTPPAGWSAPPSLPAPAGE
ncbi:hypothetical protein [Actinoplanes sp. NPDC048796]|uniref:hypothetical protein n=1 Tax=Actinoplanes sp. NPDC048796 TaxID=3155640 RepID=UPI0033EF4E93